MADPRDQRKGSKQAISNPETQPGKGPAGIPHEQHRQGPHGPAHHQGEPGPGHHEPGQGKGGSR